MIRFYLVFIPFLFFYSQGNDTILIKSWEPSYKAGFYFIGVHAYCGSDVPTNFTAAEYTVIAKETNHVIEGKPDLWVKKTDSGTIKNRTYIYHRMCVPNICNDVKVTIAHCTKPGPGCTSYGFPELLVSKNNPEVKVKDEAWKLAEGKTRSVKLHPDDVNMDAGHYYIGIYGWCTDDKKCPNPGNPKPNCGPCSKAQNVKYNITVSTTTIPKKECDKILKKRSKNSSNITKASGIFVLLALVIDMIM